MKVMQKQPAIVVSIAVAILIRALSIWDIDITWMDPELLEGGMEIVITLLGGWLISRKVFSEETIRQAGLTPDEVMARKESPAYPYAEGQ